MTGDEASSSPGEARAGAEHARAHRVVVTVEVEEHTGLSTQDLVALADVLREAATDLAPKGTTRTSVQLAGVPQPTAQPA